MPSWWSNAHREASLFLLGCMAVGCVGGLVVTGTRIWWEAWHG